MKKLIIYMITLIMLMGCSSKTLEPSVVTEYVTVERDVPDELLNASPAPDANVLKNVKIIDGKDELLQYGMDLSLVNYDNTQKINALRELLR